MLLLFQFFTKQFFFQNKEKNNGSQYWWNIKFYLFGGKKNFLASDIGPGNTLIDNFCLKKFNKNFDKNGLMAGKGTVNLKLVDEWLSKNILIKIFQGLMIPQTLDLKIFIGKRELNLQTI